MDSSGSAIIQSLPSDTSYWTSATLPLDYFGDNSTWSDPAQLPSSSSTEYTPTECSLYDWHADTTFNMDIEDCTGPKLRLLAPATDLSITIQEHTPQKPCPFTKTETKRIRRRAQNRVAQRKFRSRQIEQLRKMHEENMQWNGKHSQLLELIKTQEDEIDQLCNHITELKIEVQSLRGHERTDTSSENSSSLSPQTSPDSSSISCG